MMAQLLSLRVLLINNIPTHHQYPLAENLHQLLGENFRFACYRPVSADRAAMGWQDNELEIPWMIRAWESEHLHDEYIRWLMESDVIIGLPDDWKELKKRLSKNKLCLPATERPLKPSDPLWGTPPKQRVKSYFRHVLSYYRGKLLRIQRWHEIDSPYCHVLAIGAYCPWDFHRMRLFRNRIWTYGYFVNVPTAPPSPRVIQPVQILWAGRLVKLKRVEVLIKACKILKEKGLDFRLKIIGDGPESNSIISLVMDLGLQEMISLHPPVNPQQVRVAMQAAHIYVFPSTQQEGWGAVIGEAMSEGCAVIASDGAGSAPMLVQDGISGYLFPVDDIECLAKNLEELIMAPDKVFQMGLEGWRIMKSIWSPAVAAERLLILSEGLLGRGKVPSYHDGPCSPARLLKPRFLTERS
jgi:glycosyltransferase involved in cell wall biosynthesis